MPHPDTPPQESDYGVPSPDLIARAESGFARFLDRAEEDQEHDEEREPAG